MTTAPKSRINLKVSVKNKSTQAFMPSTRVKKKWTDSTFVEPLGRTGGVILSYLLHSSSCSKNGRARVTREEFLNAIPGIRSLTTISTNLKKLQHLKIVTSFMVRMRNKLGKFITSKIYVFTEENIARIQQLFPKLDLLKWGIKPYIYGDQFLVATKVISDTNKRSEIRQKLLQNPERISSASNVKKLGNCIAKCISTGVDMFKFKGSFQYSFADTEVSRKSLYNKILNNIPEISQVKDPDMIPQIINNLVDGFVHYQIKIKNALENQGQTPFKTSFNGWDTILNNQVQFIKKHKLVLKEEQRLLTGDTEIKEPSFASKESSFEPSSPPRNIATESASQNLLIKLLGYVKFQAWFHDVTLPDPANHPIAIKVPNSWKASKIDEMFGCELSKVYGKGNYQLIF